MREGDWGKVAAEEVRGNAKSPKGELAGYVSEEASTPGGEEAEEDNIYCI